MPKGANRKETEINARFQGEEIVDTWRYFCNYKNETVFDRFIIKSIMRKREI